jgi:hypothetical protein
MILEVGVYTHSQADGPPVSFLHCSTVTAVWGHWYCDTVERLKCMTQGHFESTSVCWGKPQRQTRVCDAQLPCVYHATYQLGFPCLTEVKAALSEGPYLSPLPRYQQLLSGGPSVAPSSPPDHSSDVHSGRSRSQHGFLLSPLLLPFLWRIWQPSGGSC